MQRVLRCTCQCLVPSALQRALPYVSALRGLPASTSSVDLCEPRTSRARILDGKATSAAWIEELKYDVRDVSARIGRPPGLAVVLVGNRADSMLYVTKKLEACAYAGVRTEVHRLPVDVSQDVLERTLSEVCADSLVDGVLVQLPLPQHLDEERCMESVNPMKDVDGFHPLNMGRVLMRGCLPRFVPCTPLGCMELLKRHHVDVSRKTAVVLGDSNIVGTPLAMLLKESGASAVTVCQRSSYQALMEDEGRRAEANVCLPRLPGPYPQKGYPLTHDPGGLHEDSEDMNPPTSSPGPDPHHLNHRDPDKAKELAAELPPWQRAPLPSPSTPSSPIHDLPGITRTADILVVAVGHPELVKAHWVKPGAVVIDVGINVVWDDPGVNPGDILKVADEGGELPLPQTGHHVVGDVALAEVSHVASAITPVPGGVGPMTIAGVIHNTVKAARYHHDLIKW